MFCQCLDNPCLTLVKLFQKEQQWNSSSQFVNHSSATNFHDVVTYLGLFCNLLSFIFHYVVNIFQINDSYQQVCQSGWQTRLSLNTFQNTNEDAKRFLTKVFLIVFLYQKRHQNPTGLLHQDGDNVMQGGTGDLCVCEHGVWTNSHCLIHQCTFLLFRSKTSNEQEGKIQGCGFQKEKILFSKLSNIYKALW